jgi:thiamine-phosphate pyrophosphorylase
VVGVTCHTYEELVRAPGSGADYAGVGAFYPSPTKPSIVSDPRPALGRLPEDYPLPLYAVGGLTLERLEEPLAFPQVRGVVVSSAIQASPDPAREARAWRARLGLTDPRMPPPRA